MVQTMQRGAKSVIFAQILVAVTGGLIGLYWGRSVALSTGLGGLVCTLPNAIFTWRVFVTQGARQAQQVLRNLFLGEAIKWLLTIGLLIVVFKMLSPQPLAFFIGFVSCQSVFWFAAPLFKLAAVRK
ncbi:MAG: ATP synthase subunit I [marine bacterium B5-7]|nr:MAG: ATP synthase subunit I [marine bacterium B5-7]